MRKEEVMNLRWEDINFYFNTITVRNTKSDQDRTVPMNEMLTAILRQLKIMSKGEWVL